MRCMKVCRHKQVLIIINLGHNSLDSSNDIACMCHIVSDAESADQTPHPTPATGDLLAITGFTLTAFYKIKGSGELCTFAFLTDTQPELLRLDRIARADGRPYHGMSGYKAQVRHAG